MACSFWDRKSFEEIYTIKSRDKGKPLSIAVRDFDALRRCVELTESQILDLQTYHRPFTIIAKRREEFRLPAFIDHPGYERLGVRIASECIEPRIAKDLDFPIFLTSANRSEEGEIYDSESVRRQLDISGLTVIEGSIPVRAPSDIFSYVGDTDVKAYLRKNHDPRDAASNPRKDSGTR